MMTHPIPQSFLKLKCQYLATTSISTLGRMKRVITFGRRSLRPIQ